MMTVQLRFYNRSKTEPYANIVCENNNKKVKKKSAVLRWNSIYNSDH